MKNSIICLAAIAMLCSTVGCANGPVREFVRNAICNDGCQAPPADPSYGFGFDSASTGDCATGNCSSSQPIVHGGQDFGSVSGSVPHSTSYINDSYSQGDPYINGSNYGGATINPPVFDSYSGPSYGSTIVPPGSSGTLPTPIGGN